MSVSADTRFTVVCDSDAREFRTLFNALRFMRRQLADFGPDYFVNDGDARTLDGAMDRVKVLLRDRNVGESLTVEARLEGAVLQRVRAFVVAPKLNVPELHAAPGIELIHALLWDQFKDLRSGGLYVPRFISGTSTVSRHGYVAADGSWKGAAEDVFVSNPNTMEHLVEVEEWLVDQAREGRCKLARAIVANRTWTPASGWVGYGGIYHRHGHNEVDDGVPFNR